MPNERIIQKLKVFRDNGKVLLDPCLINKDRLWKEMTEVFDMALEALRLQQDCKSMDDSISRKWLMECVDEGWIKFDTEKDKNIYIHLVRDIAPPAETKTCDGCKHKGNFENEVEYGYNSPCTVCKRRVSDNYERRSDKQSGGGEKGERMF